MSKRSSKLYLDDIRDSVRKVERYTKGLSRAEFFHDELRIDAVVRNLQIIGEAAKKLPKQLKAEYKAVPWSQMAGMRDKVVHEYFGVNQEILWKTVSEDIPRLKKLLKGLPKEERLF